MQSGAELRVVADYEPAGDQPDALPQALVLTAIVISMGGLAFILAMLYMI